MLKQLEHQNTIIYFLLLTVTASFMGVNARVYINEEWTEPSVLWNVVAARKGEKKTAALKRILHGVEVCIYLYALSFHHFC